MKDNIIVYFSCAVYEKFWLFSYPRSMKIKNAIQLSYKEIAFEVQCVYSFSSNLVIMKSDGQLLNPDLTFQENGIYPGDKIILV